ncbi:MAG TPA: C10 family peptidase [Bacteroidia bacterium]|nr:C10 family peptidase [Bacteroidia bacterium]
MKKINYAMFVLAVGVSVANAKPVTPLSAKTVAENFYKQNSTRTLNTSTLVHTEVATDGTPLYYAYNINDNDGFVIIAGDDAVSPIVGYSTVNKFIAPQPHSNLNFWLNEFTDGVKALKANNVVASAKTAAEWEKYTNNVAIQKQANSNNSTMTTNAVAPLMVSTWNQSPYYNALCPGGSVTGCVATTMAQIMKYWGYPAQGVGSSSYCDCTSSGYSNQYGTLSATYTATYNWAAMPLAVNSANSDVAQLMYDCGVSVNMDYDPNGSAAQVLGSSGPSAQHSYINYFKYDPTQIHGLNRNSYTDTKWLDTVEHDLNIGRCVQYVGVDPSEGGHTWVCDGYDQNNYLHMNWGWGGQSDGYFQLNNFATPGYNPSSYHQALVGIVPKSTNTTDASVLAVTSPTGVFCNNSFTPVITLKNYGSSQLTSCVINYQIDNGTVQTQNWTGTLAAQQFISVSLPTFVSTSGTHTLTCFTSAPNNTTDQDPTNDQSNTIYAVNNAVGTLPVVEGFENSNTLSDWAMSHSGSTGVDWAVTTNAAATGANSIMIDNMSNTAGNNSFLQTSASYDLSTFTTPALSFKAAYQQKATTNADKLQVFTSTDCGASWISRRVILSSALASLSGGVGSSAYTPSPSQFTTYTVNINAVAHNTGVMFRWEFLADPNGPGNNLYLDDINLYDASVSGIKNIEAIAGLNVYPNPAHGSVNIAFNLTENHNIAVNVVDMLGRIVETIPAQQHTSGETVLTIGSKAAYQAGVYFVNINIDGQQISKKIIME